MTTLLFHTPKEEHVVTIGILFSYYKISHFLTGDLRHEVNVLAVEPL